MGMGLNNSEGLGNEQLEETQDQKPTEQPGADSVEDSFTQVGLEDINRDDLTPEMQSVYDDMLQKRASMQGDYTRKTTAASEVQRDAELWRQVMQHPELAKIMTDAIYRIERGQPASGEVHTSPAEPPDAETDPVAFIQHTIREGIREEVGKYLPDIRSAIGEVTQFTRGTQADQEFDILCAQYPGAELVGRAEIDRVRSQYQDSTGRPISMRKALGILALDQPLLLQQPSSPPGQTRTRKAPVEKPTEARGQTEFTPVPEGIVKIREAMEAQEKAGVLGDMGAAIRRGFSKLPGRGR